MKLTEVIYDTINCKQYPLAIFTDYPKSFDTANHGILLCELERYGISGIVLDILLSNLSDRVQRIRFGEGISGERSLTVGLPQV